MPTTGRLGIGGERGPPQCTRDFAARCTIESHATSDDSFSATLRARERRLAGRLEGFGDIVFGFAVSQCALQLPVSNGHVAIANPITLLLYFGTFAVLVSLWLIYHRMMSGTYKPSGLDLLIPFAYLALVSLVPFAMYEIAHNNQSSASARSALLGYLTLYAAMTALSTVLSFRNLRRGYFFLGEEDRNHAWQIFLRQSVLCVTMTLALGVDALAGATRAGIFLCSLFVVIRLPRWLFPRAPSAARLRLDVSNAGRSAAADLTR